jgi:hypothetical protein
MGRPKKAVEKKAPKKKPKYLLEIEVNDDVYSKPTNDILEAIDAFVPPPTIKTHVYFRVTAGKVSHEEVYKVQDARHLFASPVMKELLVKQFSTFF